MKLLWPAEELRNVSSGDWPSNTLAGDELRAIKRYVAIHTDAQPWLSISERGQPLPRPSVNYLVAEGAGRAGLQPVHPHMLRHSRRFSLANRGYDLRLIQDYLGHRDPKHPVQASVAVLHTLVVTGPNVRPDADTIDGCQ